MSCMQFQQVCRNCRHVWSATFGVVGTTQIASAPTNCPKCGSADIEGKRAHCRACAGEPDVEYVFGGDFQASPIDSGSPEAEARDRIERIGFAETERRLAALTAQLTEATKECGKQKDEAELWRLREKARADQLLHQTEIDRQAIEAWKLALKTGNWKGGRDGR